MCEDTEADQGPLCAREGAGPEFRQAPGFGLENMATVNRQAGGGVFIFPALLRCN